MKSVKYLELSKYQIGVRLSDFNKLGPKVIDVSMLINSKFHKLNQNMKKLITFADIFYSIIKDAGKFKIEGNLEDIKDPQNYIGPI